jgi:hypothetical protein
MSTQFGVAVSLTPEGSNLTVTVFDEAVVFVKIICLTIVVVLLGTV